MRPSSSARSVEAFLRGARVSLQEGKLFLKSLLLPQISLLNQSSGMLLQIRLIIPHGRFNVRERESTAGWI